MRPGGVIPAHRHQHEEECLVLEGECRIGTHRLVAGDVHVAAAGSWHEAARRAAVCSFCYAASIRIRFRLCA